MKCLNVIINTQDEPIDLEALWFTAIKPQTTQTSNYLKNAVYEGTNILTDHFSRTENYTSPKVHFDSPLQMHLARIEVRCPVIGSKTFSVKQKNTLSRNSSHIGLFTDLHF